VQLFLITFIFFAVILTLMSIGVILKGKPIKGSCGGVAAMFGLDGCFFCSKKRKGECPAQKAANTSKTD
jgi:hypothetical protein